MKLNYASYQVRPIWKSDVAEHKSTFGNMNDAITYKRNLRNIGILSVIRYPTFHDDIPGEVISLR